MQLPELTKLYYSIGEIADIFKVAPSLIRYWESEFPLLKPGKNSKGDRKYTPKDIELINKIFNLVKERGFTIEGANKELMNAKQTDKELENVLSRLKQLKNKLILIKSGKI
jgi:DNA-binding transcriptional MerR regulator